MDTYEYRVMHMRFDERYQYSVVASLAEAAKLVANLESVADVAGIRPIWLERRVVLTWEKMAGTVLAT